MKNGNLAHRVTGDLRTGRSSEGFSLVELMTVIAIVGILSTVAAMEYRKLMQMAEVKAETAILVKAMRVLHQTTGEWNHLPSGNIKNINDWKSEEAGLLRDDSDRPFHNWPGPQFEDNEKFEDLVTDPWGTPYYVDATTIPAFGGDLGPNGTGVMSAGPDKSVDGPGTDNIHLYTDFFRPE